MTNFTKLAVIGLTSAALTTTALAGAGNGAPSGPHYNLNIIGVENPKKSNMTGSNRHTIFVALKSTKSGKYSKDRFDESGDVIEGSGTAIVDSKIWLTSGEDFKVCDGNGFDPAYGCGDDFDQNWADWNGTYWDENGEPHELADKKNGAVFQLPCNENLPASTTDMELVACDGEASAHYQVWARALGSPKNDPSATMTTCATLDGELQCSLENEVLTRSTGKSSFTDVTNELTSLVVQYCTGDVIDGVCDGRVTYTRIALFAGNTEDWFWNYDNNGLRLAQLRFYAAD